MSTSMSKIAQHQRTQTEIDNLSCATWENNILKKHRPGERHNLANICCLTTPDLSQVPISVFNRKKLTTQSKYLIATNLLFPRAR